MGNEDTARIEESTPKPSRENEWQLPQDAHKRAGRSHQTASQKPGTAGVDRGKTWVNLNHALAAASRERAETMWFWRS